MPSIKIIDTFLFNPAIPLLRTHTKDASKNKKRYMKVIEWGIVGSGKRLWTACCLWAVRGVNSGAATQRNSGCKMGQGRGGLLDTDVTSSGYIWTLKKGSLLYVECYFLCAEGHTQARTRFIFAKRTIQKLKRLPAGKGEHSLGWGWIYLFMWLWLWNHYM